MGLPDLSPRHLFEVELQNRAYTLEYALSESDLVEAKKLDDLVFAGHQGISMEELHEIAEHGAVILLRDLQGKLIGESQVITSPISQHPHLEEDQAFDYGTAIHPDYQNMGIAQLLFKAQEKVAIEAGKSRNTLTVRLENAKSIRGRFKCGYQIVDYSQDYYGPLEKDGARLFMEKNHVNTSSTLSSETMLKMITDEKLVYINNKTVDQAVNENHPFLCMEVVVGDTVDFDAHLIISKVLPTKKYIGVALIKPEELSINLDQSSLLVLKHV